MLNKLKILFCGHDSGAHDALKAMLATNKYLIECVVLRAKTKDQEISNLALSKKIKTTSPEKINDKKFLDFVKKLDLDLIISINYNQIFKSEIINLPKLGIINIHNGMLPNYGGGGGLYGAIINDQSFFGQTSHFVDEGIDTGSIILQDNFEIKKEDNMADLLEKGNNNVPKLLIRTLECIQQPNYKKTKSNSSGIYFAKKPEGDEIINWNETSKLIYNKIRARNPSPYCKTFVGEQEVLIKTASLTTMQNYEGPVGQVIRKVTGKGVLVKTGDNAIMIQEIFTKDKTKSTIANFKIGTCFLSNILYEYTNILKKYNDLLKRVENIESYINDGGDIPVVS
jgi:methionyl-tRNA formyltransferase